MPSTASFLGCHYGDLFNLAFLRWSWFHIIWFVSIKAMSKYITKCDLVFSVFCRLYLNQETMRSSVRGGGCGDITEVYLLALL